MKTKITITKQFLLKYLNSAIIENQDLENEKRKLQKKFKKSKSKMKERNLLDEYNFKKNYKWNV